MKPRSLPEVSREAGAAKSLVSLLFAAALVFSLSAPLAAQAAIPKDTTLGRDIPVAWDVATGGCACARERAAVTAYRDRILAAPTPEAARELALSQTRLAHGALARARWIMPFSRTIGKTSDKLEEYEARVRDARTQADVAREFSGLVRLADAKPGTIVDTVELKGKTCSYTTTEIVIIVIGFLFAIIPGIIFMFLLC
jgi:hypothetical protein